MIPNCGSLACDALGLNENEECGTDVVGNPARVWSDHR